MQQKIPNEHSLGFTSRTLSALNRWRVRRIQISTKFGLVFAVCGLTLFGTTVSVAELEIENFPAEPLRLLDALSYADKPHPETGDVRYALEEAQVLMEHHHSYNQYSAQANFVPRKATRAAPNLPHSLDDGYANLELRFSLYDFGRTEAERSLAMTSVELAQQRFDYARQLRKLEIMRRFFAVLEADLDYAVKNEKMTLAFLYFNRHFEQMQMHQSHAEVDVLDLETKYLEAFSIRQQAGIEQLAARRNIGLALGYTDYVPRDLQPPNLSAYAEREVEDFELLLEKVTNSNYLINIARLNVQHAKGTAESADARYQPKLDAVVVGTEWEQESGSRNSATLSVQLNFPLADPKRSRDRRVSLIKIRRAEAQLSEIEHTVRKRVFDLWKTLSLLHVDLRVAQTRLEFRDQYMDRSRTMYELEERSDLGDAQAELLRAQLEMDKVHHKLALAWSELDALMGNPVYAF